MYCWGNSRLGVDPPPPMMSDERSRLYDSVFTYNTERQFRNTYSTYVAPVYEITGEEDGTPTPSKLLELFFMVISALLTIMTLPFSLFFTVKLVGPNERLVVTRLGRSRDVMEPGVTFVFPLIDNAVRIDIRVQSFELPAFQVVTVDRGLVEVGVVVFSQIVDPVKAHLCLQNREQTLRSLSYNVSYNNLVKRTMADLTDPDALARIFDKAKEEFNQFCQNLGIVVTKIAVRQLRVVKPAENQAVSLFNTLMKSELGEQLMRGLAPVLQAYMCTPTADGRCEQQSEAESVAKRMSEKTEDSVPKPKLVFSLSPLIEQQQSSQTTEIECKTENTKCDGDDITDPEINVLLKKVCACCDEQLVSQVDRHYIIHVLYDEEEMNFINVDQRAEENENELNNPNPPASNCMGVFDLDLRIGGTGSCRWLNGTTVIESPVDGVVSCFALRKSTLLALASGVVSPFGAYLNGAVEIVKGTITDAIPLRHLAARVAVTSDVE